MQKNRVLLMIGILLLASTAVAQGQAIYEAFGNPVMAREGGAGEKAGNIVLFLRGNHNGGMVTVRYSAPLAAGTVAMANAGATATTDVDEGTVTVAMPSSGNDTVTISGVRLDLRKATVPVTATFSGDANAFVSGVATVISAIRDALEVESTKDQILTRGGMGSATVTIKEAFASAFTAEADVKLTLVGVPAKAHLTVMHVQPEDPDEAADDADVAGNVTLNTDTMIVTAGDTEINELTMTGDGDKINITVGFTAPNAASTESLKLMFDLAATSDQDDLMLPLDAGMVEVWVTMAPTEKPDTVDANTEYFAVNYIPADGVVAFTFKPASCTLLFPYVVSHLENGIYTGIVVTNPTSFAEPNLSGSIMFHLYRNDGFPVIAYATDGNTSGKGLEPDGSLAAGGTYSVLLREILDDAGSGDNFEGHMYVRTDFTRCSGLGLVSDYSTFTQGYLPELIEDDIAPGSQSRLP